MKIILFSFSCIIFVLIYENTTFLKLWDFHIYLKWLVGVHWGITCNNLCLYRWCIGELHSESVLAAVIADFLYVWNTHAAEKH